LAKSGVLTVDFGSTYTKVALIDMDESKLAGTAMAPTTVSTDITIGLAEAMAQLESRVDLSAFEIKHRLACSSAAGGLRMVAIGLVPDLTVEAARRAALGAGAKVVGSYGYELTAEDAAEIRSKNPDIILLTGGTDGGNKDVILKNATTLASSGVNAPVVVAGNRVVASKVRDILASAGLGVRVTENVMPEFGVLHIEPVRETIRQVFMERIVVAKGLAKAEEFAGGIVMPTPAAVLKAAELLARGTRSQPGLGDIIVVDVGGATTDVHSIAKGDPTKPGVMLRGLPEPYAKRTVEGDLGVRVSALALVEAVGPDKVVSLLGRETVMEIAGRLGCTPASPEPGGGEGAAEVDDGEAAALAALAIGKRLSEETERVPETPSERELDTVLAMLACREAVLRHVGVLETVYTPFGATYVQRGKDLSAVPVVIGTGGVIVRNESAWRILTEAVAENEAELTLRPRNPGLAVDRDYILSAAGLLAQVDADTALKVMRSSLEWVERPDPAVSWAGQRGPVNRSIPAGSSEMSGRGREAKEALQCT